MKRLLLVLLLIAGSALWADGLRQVLQVPDPLTVGSPFTLTLTFDGAKTFGVPEKDSLDTFELVSAIPKSSGWFHRKATLTLTMTAWDTGELNGPIFRVPVTVGKTNQTITTQPFSVTVTSVLPDSLQTVADTSKVAAALKDIAPIRPVRPGVLDIALPVLLLAGLGYYLYRRHKRPAKTNETPAAPPPPPVPAYQRALVLLDELRRERVLERGDFVEFYYRLSMILRFYVEERDGFKAMEMTTAEVRDTWHNPNAEERNQILRFLAEADRIKFARHLPDSEAGNRAASYVETYLREEGRKNGKSTVNPSILPSDKEK
jgi:hypothetical protein